MSQGQERLLGKTKFCLSSFLPCTLWSVFCFRTCKVFHAFSASLMSLLFPFSFLFGQELSLSLFYTVVGLMESPGTRLGPTFLKRSRVIMCNVNDCGHDRVSCPWWSLQSGRHDSCCDFSQGNMIGASVRSLGALRVPLLCDWPVSWDCQSGLTV